VRRLLTLLAALTLIGAASAHAELEESTPAAGETVRTLPEAVTLNFTEPLEVRFSTFKVYPLGADLDMSAEDARARLNGLAGALVSEVLTAQGDEAARADAGVSTAERTSREITLPLKDGLEPGHYVVMWRALSVDTHTTQGFYVFTYAPEG